MYLATHILNAGSLAMKKLSEMSIVDGMVTYFKSSELYTDIKQLDNLKDMTIEWK